MKVLDKIKKWWDNFCSIDVKMDDHEPQTPECGGKQKDKPCVCGGECPCEICSGVRNVDTLRDAFTDYIYICRKEKRFAESTIDSYEVIRDKHLQWIIDRKLDDLTKDDCQIAIDNERAKGMSVNTVKKYRLALMKVLKEYRPDFNPTLNVW